MIDGIFEFTFRPKPDKKPAAIVFGILMAMGAAIVIASAVAEKYKGVISLGAVIVLCAAIYIFVRYLVSDYAYALVFDNNGLPNLIVTRKIGKSVTTLFAIPVSRIQAARGESAEDRKRHEAPFGTKKYNYCASLNPDKTYRLSAAGREGRAEIVLECTPAVADRLVEYAAIARAYEEEE